MIILCRDNINSAFVLTKYLLTAQMQSDCSCIDKRRTQLCANRSFIQLTNCQPSDKSKQVTNIYIK
jgi:hypothetical protein